MYDLTGSQTNKGFVGFSFSDALGSQIKVHCVSAVGLQRRFVVTLWKGGGSAKGGSICINCLLRCAARATCRHRANLIKSKATRSKNPPRGKPVVCFTPVSPRALGTGVLAMTRKTNFDFEQTEPRITTLEQTAGAIALSFTNILWATHWLPGAWYNKCHEIRLVKSTQAAKLEHYYISLKASENSSILWWRWNLC